jgi:hypothetical protein
LSRIHDPETVKYEKQFQILEPGLSTREIKNRIANFTRVTNKYLKRIGEELGIPTKLTTYTA